MAIVGNGDIASILPDRGDLLFFASGVSNSAEVDEAQYQREVDLLLDQPRNVHLVYFGSLSIFYSDSRYARHKMHMEGLIRENFPNYTIVRLGNITWGNNPHTLINFLRNSIRQAKPFSIQDTYRFVVDRGEFLYWINLIPKWNCEMNLTGRRMSIKQIVEELCRT